MDLEKMTVDITVPVRTLKILSEFFDREINENTCLHKELSEFCKILHTYNFMLHLISDELVRIRNKYNAKVEKYYNRMV